VLQWFLAVGILVLFLICGCKNQRNDEKVLFVFKGEKVLVSEFRHLYKRWLAQKNIDDSRETRESFMYNWIADEILHDKGVREGIEYLPEVALKLKEYKKQLIIEYMHKTVENDMYRLSEEDVRTYYHEHKSEFEREKLFRLTAVRLRDRVLADQIVSQIENGNSSGMSLGMLSARYSDDEFLVDANGDWGLFSEDVMDPSWKNLVLNGKLGDLIGPVRDGDGFFCIIEISGYAYKRQLSYRRAYPLIIRKMVGKDGSRIMEEYRSTLIKHYGVKINTEYLSWE
jgi:peptidyl-prolyl cis-trans isomerase C